MYDKGPLPQQSDWQLENLNFQIYIAQYGTNSKAETEFSVHLHWTSDTKWDKHKRTNKQAPVPEQKEGVALVERKHTRMMGVGSEGGRGEVTSGTSQTVIAKTGLIKPIRPREAAQYSSSIPTVVRSPFSNSN